MQSDRWRRRCPCRMPVVVGCGCVHWLQVHSRLPSPLTNMILSKCLNTTLLSSSSNGSRKTLPVVTVYSRSILAFGKVCTRSFSIRPSRPHWIQSMMFTCVRRTSYQYIRLVHLETEYGTCLRAVFTVVRRVCDPDCATQRVPCVYVIFLTKPKLNLSLQ